MFFLDGEYDIRNMVVLLAIMGLVPFMLAMVTPFVRLMIVGGLLRQALGLQQVPPNSVLTGMALVLTLHIMSPVIEDGWSRWQEAGTDVEARIDAVHGPLREFLECHAGQDNIDLFRNLRASRVASHEGSEPKDERLATLTVYVPAFMLSELRAAFLAGVLIFIGFLVVDLVVGNILLALGMHMLSPVTVSLPLKIALFVFVGGWQRIIVGVVESY